MDYSLCSPKSLLLREKVDDGGLSPNCMAPCQWWRLGQECVSAFPVSFSTACFILAHGAGVSHLVSGFLTKWIDECVVVESVCPCGEEEATASYSSILLTLLPVPLFLKIRFPSSIISLQPEEVCLIFFGCRSFRSELSFSFILRCLYWLSFLNDVFIGYRSLSWPFLSLCRLNMPCLALASTLSHGNIKTCLGIVFSLFTVVDFDEHLDSVYLCSITFGKVSTSCHSTLIYSFYPILSILSFWVSNYTYFRPLDVFTMVPALCSLVFQYFLLSGHYIGCFHWLFPLSSLFQHVQKKVLFSIL